MTYTQVIFPERGVGKQRGQGGILMGFRVNKNDLENFYQADQADSVRLNPFKGSLMQQGWEYSREIADGDGNPMPDDLEIVIHDSHSYSGVSDGTPVSQDYADAGSSLLDDFFSDDSATYTCFVTKIERKGTNGVANGTTTFVGSGFKAGMVGRGIEIEGKGIYKVVGFTNSTTITLSGSPTAGTDLKYWVHHIWFIGDCDPKTITREHFLTHAPHTTGAYRYQAVAFNWNMAAYRMQQKTLGAMQADATYQFVEADMTNPYRVAFYGGTVCRPGNSVFHNAEYWEDQNVIALFDDSVDWQDNFQNASYGAFPAYGAAVWPAGFHGVSFSKILTKCAAYSQVQFDSSTDVDNKWVPYNEAYNETTPGYDRAKLCDAADALDELNVNYNFVFGHSYLPDTVPDYTAFFESPVSFPPDATMDEVVQAVADRFTLGIFWEYDHETFKPVMKLRDLKTLGAVFQDGSTGICESWVLASSREQERDSSKQRAYLHYLADEGGISSPKKDGDEIDVEIRWRTRPTGTEDSMKRRHLIFDPGAPIAHQFNRWYSTNGDQEVMNPDGWFGGTLMYHYKPADTTFQFYPDHVPADGYNSTDWEGFYPISHVVYEGGATFLAAYEPEKHPLEEPARYFGDEFAGNKVILDREYYGVLADNGDISTVTPLMTMVESFRGDDLTFKARSLNQGFTSTLSKIIWQGHREKVEWNAEPVFLDSSEAGNLTGGSSSGSTGGNGNSYQPFLKQKPVTQIDNTATAQTDIVPLTQIGFEAGTANLHELKWNPSGTPATVAGTTFNGLNFAKAFACNVTPVSATYQILSTDGMVVATANTFTATLIAAPIEGQGVVVSNQGSGTLTVARSGSQTINGVTTSRTLAQYETEVYRYDGVSNWVIEANLGGGGSLTGALIKAPNSSTRNEAQPTGDYPALRLLKPSGATSSNILEVADALGTVEWRIDASRNMIVDLGSEFNYEMVVNQDAAGGGVYIIAAAAPAVNPLDVRDNTDSQSFLAVELDGRTYIQKHVTEEDVELVPGVATVGVAPVTLTLTESAIAVDTSLGANYAIAGIAAPASSRARVITLWNNTAFVMTLNDQDAGATAGNRFACPGAANYAVAAGGCVRVIYMVNLLTGGRWRVHV
jgi:hypothetical protein